MIRTTSINFACLNYFRRTPHFPTNHFRKRWMPPRRAHRISFVANKNDAMEYKDPNQRSGYEWYQKTKHRGLYRHWPWSRWTDDPINNHKHPDEAPSRMLSCLDSSPSRGRPQYDCYSETNRDYDTPSTAPPHMMVEFINVFAGKVWSRSMIQRYLTILGDIWPTIEALCNNTDVVKRWNERNALIPDGLLTHSLLAAKDIVTQNTLKRARCDLHARGVLRTREMERYYALPYHHGPATPVKLAQAPGVYPKGEYLYMIKRQKYSHELQPNTGLWTKQFYPL